MYIYDRIPLLVSSSFCIECMFIYIAVICLNKVSR